MLERIKKVKNWVYILVMFINLFLLDYVIRKIYEGYSYVDIYNKVPLLFVLGWILILTGICCVLPGVLKKVYAIFFMTVFAILIVVQNAYDNVFYKFFSVSDLSLLSEGTKFMDISYINL